MTIPLESDSLDERACGVFFARILEKTPATIPFWLSVLTEVDIIHIGVISFYFLREIEHRTREE